jgi:hypothetical protein
MVNVSLVRPLDITKHCADLQSLTATIPNGPAELRDLIRRLKSMIGNLRKI